MDDFWGSMDAAIGVMARKIIGELICGKDLQV